jgi:hypothetical protein
MARRGIESSGKAETAPLGGGTALSSWLNRYRRLKIRRERQDGVHQAFLDIACALICWRYARRSCWAY